MNPQVYHPVNQDAANPNWSRRVSVGPFTFTVDQRVGRYLVAGCAVLFVALLLLPREALQAAPSSSPAGQKDDGKPVDGLPAGNLTGETLSLVTPPNEFAASDDSSGATLPPVAQLPPRESSPIAHLTCAPKACALPKHYGKLGSNYTVLSSMPGSGNTFLRSIIEEGTRIFSGSMYHDSDLKNDFGFKGESKNPWAGNQAQFSVIKSHYPFFHDMHIPARVNAAVHIVRAPFDALLSEFNREYGNSHVGRAPMEILHSKFVSWLAKRHLVWTRTMRFWLGGNGSAELHPDHPDRVSSFVLLRHMDPKGPVAIPVLVMFYEDFVRDFEEASRVLFTFLRDRMGDNMPSVEDAVACAVAGHEREMKLQRVAHKATLKPYNPYHDVKGTGIGQGMIDRWCKEFEAHWHALKWGPCKSALLQIERGIPVRAQSQVPEESCH